MSEFIRITDTLMPDKVFRRFLPELANNSCTPAGVPVRAQLLGSDPVCLAENAAKLAELNPEGIDLNFGCPAKTVNRHRGGAVLLDEPQLVGEIVAAVRRAVPAHLPVSAKMRLGYNDTNYAVECAQAIEAAGACELVVHARTKADGYKPPAYWEHIPAIREAVRIPVIANGEIWTVEEAQRCRDVTGCADIMIGRGAVSDPGLAMAIALQGRNNASGRNLTWDELQPLISEFWTLIDTHLEVRHKAGRLKQWLNYLRRTYPQAQELYARVRTINEPLQLARCVIGDSREVPYSASDDAALGVRSQFRTVTPPQRAVSYEIGL